MTATPHNGKEEDFQLFLAPLDCDRFEGRFRDGVHVADVSDLMRRMVKERLLKFDGRPLFPERIAHTVPYKLSDAEARLYTAVTDYVREEFEVLRRGGQPSPTVAFTAPELDADDVADLDDAPEQEVEDIEARILDQATAARSIAELKAEIETLTALEAIALAVRRTGRDTKWREFASLLSEIFTATGRSGGTGEPSNPSGEGMVPGPAPSPQQKLVVFTERRDTLRYLQERITTLLGRETSVVVLHGSVGREERLAAQEAFRHELQDLLEERQLVHDAMDATRVQRVRGEMERAEARRL